MTDWLLIGLLIVTGVFIPILIALWRRQNSLSDNDLTHIIERLKGLEEKVGRVEKKVDDHIQFHLKEN